MKQAHDNLPLRLRRLHEVWLHDGHPTYFLTLCTAKRARVLATTIVHERLRAFLADGPARYGWWTACYVLMPDHLHLFARTNSDRVQLGAWIKALKAMVARHEFRWQTGYFDHVLRSAESRAEKWEYVRLNPVRAGLVDIAEKWPYAGAFHPVTGLPMVSRKTAASGTRPTTGDTDDGGVGPVPYRA